MKLTVKVEIKPLPLAAAFGRLCVETLAYAYSGVLVDAAAFGRLCVETVKDLLRNGGSVAAAFGRLCVETLCSGGSKRGV